MMPAIKTMRPIATATGRETGIVFDCRTTPTSVIIAPVIIKTIEMVAVFTITSSVCYTIFYLPTSLPPLRQYFLPSKSGGTKKEKGHVNHEKNTGDDEKPVDVQTDDAHFAGKINRH